MFSVLDCRGGDRSVDRAQGRHLDDEGLCAAYVVSNEIGEPYSPAVLSRYWRDTVKAADVRHIKLHAARHTCATLRHLSGVTTRPMRSRAAGANLDRVVTSCDTDTG
jgi:integrase